MSLFSGPGQLDSTDSERESSLGSRADLRRTLQTRALGGEGHPSNQPSSRPNLSRSPSQNWNSFLKNHANEVGACDFLPVIDLFFRQVNVHFIVESGSRRVVHSG